MNTWGARSTSLLSSVARRRAVLRRRPPVDIHDHPTLLARLKPFPGKRSARLNNHWCGAARSTARQETDARRRQLPRRDDVQGRENVGVVAMHALLHRPGRPPRAGSAFRAAADCPSFAQVLQLAAQQLVTFRQAESSTGVPGLMQVKAPNTLKMCHAQIGREANSGQSRGFASDLHGRRC